MIKRYLFIVCILVIPVLTQAQKNPKKELLSQIHKVMDSLKGKVGLGVWGLDFKDTILINDKAHYPMQSVFKFPLALAVLDKVDKGELSLGRIIHIKRQELDTDTWSPMVREFQLPKIDMTVNDVLRYSVSKSDNNACDILFGLTSPAYVNDFVHGKGVKDIEIDATEAQMKKGWDVQYTNWCKPSAMLQLLSLFYNQKLLKPETNEILMKLMVESENSPLRLKGLLPANAKVAHKTGTSNTNDKGLRAATNDVGIITLPDGRHYAIVVYLSDYKASFEKGEHTIAAISKLVWDYYCMK